MKPNPAYIDQLRQKQAILEQIKNDVLEENLDQLNPDYWLDQIITNDPGMLKIKEQIRKIQKSDKTILILGETGTGKELVARAIHGPKNGPFIAINCAGIPGELLEAEFFGAAKGSYTGCNNDRRGLVEEANGGTLFLDEIADMPLLLQCKLLRFLQDKSYRPLGQQAEKRSTARIIAATNHVNLGKSKKFRKDLYYRLSTFKLTLPPIGERVVEDIQLVVEKFLQEKSLIEQTIEEIKTLIHEDEEFREGNMRSILNLIERKNIGL